MTDQHDPPRRRAPGVAATLLVLTACCVPALHALPDFSGGRRAGAIEVFPDHQRGDLYYYPPSGLRLVQDTEGRPGMHLLQVRYLGTRSAGDRDRSLQRSVLSFRVELVEPPTEVRSEARRLLEGNGHRAELRPVPVARIETVMVFAPAGADGANADSADERGGVQQSNVEGVLLPEGAFEAEDDAGLGSRASYWHERRFALRLDAATAQLLLEALRRDQGLFSLGYAFFARGIGAAGTERPTGSPALVRALRRRIRADAGRRSTATAGGAPQIQLLVSGATSIAADLGRWPDLVERVDLNQRTPPGYGLLDVYCFDFRDGLRPQLALKRVELEASAAAGGAQGDTRGETVRRELTFEATAPELTLHTLRFPFAVRLDAPYRYRVVEVARDGRQTVGPWRTRRSWEALLDVTGTILGESDEHATVETSQTVSRGGE